MIAYPEWIPLAHTPTPFTRLDRTSRAVGHEIWVKHDDLTGSALSGNKVRKLEFLARQALDLRADLLVTCGGVNSNHARATAVVAARLGLASHLVLRGEDRRPPVGNLLLDRMVGARIQFITHDQWKERDRIMAEVAEAHAEKGGRAYVIPEGGSNALGSLGYTLAVEELLAQADGVGVRIQSIVHAVGSGGTTAGLAMGVALAGRSEIDVVGVAVCDDRRYFEAKIDKILGEAREAGYIDATLQARARFRIVEGYKGSGYAITSKEEMKEHRSLAEREGLFVDPVYTGKAFRGLLGEAKAGNLGKGPTVFLHTGGIFELFAYGDMLD